MVIDKEKKKRGKKKEGRKKRREVERERVIPDEVKISSESTMECCSRRPC